VLPLKVLPLKVLPLKVLPLKVLPLRVANSGKSDLFRHSTCPRCKSSRARCV